jgi:hypothetical protein
MIGIINTGAIGKAMAPGVRRWYGLAYREYPTEYTKWFEQLDTKRAYEEEVSMTGFGLPVLKPENAPITYTSQKQGYIKTYRPVVWALGYQVSFEAIINNLYPQLTKRRTKQLARSMHHGREHVHANIFNRATNPSAKYAGADGKPLLATDHPFQGGGGTWSNLMATSADISETTLESLAIQAAGWTDDEGLIIGVQLKQLIIPKALEFETARILESSKQYDTNNNAINVLRAHGTIPGGYTVCHRLTSPRRFFIQTDVADGLKTYNRYKSGPRQDNVFDTLAIKYAEIDMYDCGWTDSHCVIGSDPTAPLAA